MLQGDDRVDVRPVLPAYPAAALFLPKAQGGRRGQEHYQRVPQHLRLSPQDIQRLVGQGKI